MPCKFEGLALLLRAKEDDPRTIFVTLQAVYRCGMSYKIYLKAANWPI